MNETIFIIVRGILRAQRENNRTKYQLKLIDAEIQLARFKMEVLKLVINEIFEERKAIIDTLQALALSSNDPRERFGYAQLLMQFPHLPTFATIGDAAKSIEHAIRSHGIAEEPVIKHFMAIN